MSAALHRWAIGLTALVTLLVATSMAAAENQGSDVISNIAPADAAAGASRPPGVNYELDIHVETGALDPGGQVAKIPHTLAALVWSANRILMGEVIRLFGVAFDLDLLSGESGALAPVGASIARLYSETLGPTWLSAAVVIAGLWATYHGLIRRDYTHTTARLALSVVFVLLALAIVRQPVAIIGSVTGWTNDFAVAALAALSVQKGSDPRSAVGDALHRQFIHEPWQVLNFGGLEVCTDGDGRPVAKGGASVCRPTSAYAQRFLAHHPGSTEREREYLALRDATTAVGDNGLIPSIDIAGPIATPGIGAKTTPDQFAGYSVDVHDRPAVDIQQRGAGSQRFVIALAILLASLGAALLIGALSLAIILTQVIALLLAAFAPAALIAGAIPGRGHELFARWGGALAGSLIAKAALSLALAVVLGVAGAVQGASQSLGFLLAFTLVSAFYWVVFLQRRTIWSALTATAAASGVAVPLGRHGRATTRRVGRVARGVTRRRPDPSPERDGDPDPDTDQTHKGPAGGNASTSRNGPPRVTPRERAHRAGAREGSHPPTRPAGRAATASTPSTPSPGGSTAVQSATALSTPPKTKPSTSPETASAGPRPPGEPPPTTSRPMNDRAASGRVPVAEQRDQAPRTPPPSAAPTRTGERHPRIPPPEPPPRVSPPKQAPRV